MIDERGTRGPRRVVVVDDSRTIRALLRATLDADPRLTVVGEAGDPFEARERIKDLNPDVITLDVEMPRMNGLEFLEKLMRLRPLPVVMVSTRTKEKSAEAVRALSIGAVDCVDVARVQADADQRARLCDALVTAASARVALGPSPAMEPARGPVMPAVGTYRWNGRIVLIGSSTGGVDAIERTVGGFPADGPPAVIAQHMPEAFLRSFAHRLNDHVAPTVRLAQDGAAPRQGEILIAPGGIMHLEFLHASELRLRLVPTGGAELHVPSVDRLFRSAVVHAPRMLGVILTGMGRDGAGGLLELRSAGAATLGQSGETCVVDGMPRAARDAGAVERSVALGAMGDAILSACSSTRSGWNA